MRPSTTGRLTRNCIGAAGWNNARVNDWSPVSPPHRDVTMPVLSAAIGVPVVARLPLWGLLVRPSQCGSRKAYDQSDGEKDGLHEKPPLAPRHKTVIYVDVIKVQLIAMCDLPLPTSPFQPLAAQRVAGEKQPRPQSRPPRRAARRQQPKRPLGGGDCAGKGKIGPLCARVLTASASERA